MEDKILQALENLIKATNNYAFTIRVSKFLLDQVPKETGNDLMNNSEKIKQKLDELETAEMYLSYAQRKLKK